VQELTDYHAKPRETQKTAAGNRRTGAMHRQVAD
jgi:hypothetical protein